MLDEVDAPLDDANVGRYAKLVKEMSESVQFIYITHNKIAMEAAERLMGVTMQEPGVSGPWLRRVATSQEFPYLPMRACHLGVPAQADSNAMPTKCFDNSELLKKRGVDGGVVAAV